MEIEDKRRYFKLIVKRYHRAGRREKSQILTEFCANVGLCRKYAIRLSNEGYSRRRARPGRRSRYQGKLFLKILKKIPGPLFLRDLEVLVPREQKARRVSRAVL